MLNFLKDRRGYGTAELLVVIVATAAIATAVLSNLLTPLQNLHNRAANNIQTFGGSGF